MSEHLTKALARIGTKSGNPLPFAQESDSVPTERPMLSAAEQYAHNRGVVYSCVRLTANTIAGQPFCVGRRTTKQRGQYQTKALQESLPLSLKALAGKIEELEAHPILDLLADPNELSTEWTLKYVTSASLDLTGRALWYLLEENGKRYIHPIPTSWVSEIDYKNRVWQIRLPGATKDFPIPSSQICHFYLPDPADPRQALSPLQAAASAVNADESIQVAQGRAFQSGLFPGLAVKVGQTTDANGSKHRQELSPSQRQQLIQTIRGAVGGVTRNGEPIILDNMIEEVFPITTKPSEMGFLESFKLTERRIQRIFGCNPIVLGEIEGGNRAQAVAAAENYYSCKVNPLLSMMSQVATEWLGPWYAKPNEKLYVWLPAMVAHDAEITERKWAISGKHATVNEHRARLGLPPIKGGNSPEKQFKAIGKTLKHG